MIQCVSSRQFTERRLNGARAVKIQYVMMIPMSSVEQHYEHDFREHTHTRLENDRQLSDKLGGIRSGEDIESLERFAKGYLGMFLDLDNTIPPNQRISILANPSLAQAIDQGFESILKTGRFPTPSAIADSMLDDKPFAIGYILLAALDLFSDRQRYQIEQLPADTVIAAICCHYAYKTELHDHWLARVFMSRPELVARALAAFWQQLTARDTDHLPGLYQIISHQQYDSISAQVVLPVLAGWTTCRKSTLRDLLHSAIRCADHRQLLQICEDALQNWNAAEPARYILWLAAAFLLAPAKYDMVLADYCGRSKEKILPLLDFSVMVLMTDNEQRLPLTADTYTQLLRIIAPKFTPQQDRYGNLCDNTQKVMYLFYRLATNPDEDTESAIKRLRLVRVMKLYQSILDAVVSVHRHSRNTQVPEFEDFIAQLMDQNRVKSKLKWSDV